jgi:hypothetical protein
MTIGGLRSAQEATAGILPAFAAVPEVFEVVLMVGLIGLANHRR